MPATISKEDFLKFRDTLNRLECLAEVASKLSLVPDTHSDIDNGIDHTLQLLEVVNVNTSESNAIEELERLVNISGIISEIGGCGPRCSLLSKIINTKIDFLMTGSFSTLVSEGGVEPQAALKRLAEIRSKVFFLGRLDDLLKAKIREVSWGSRAKPLGGSTTVSSANVTADPAPVSQKQETAERDQLNECEESKTTAKSVSSPSTSLQDWDEVHAQNGNGYGSTTDRAELTPTSSIMFGQLDLTDG